MVNNDGRPVRLFLFRLLRGVTVFINVTEQKVRSSLWSEMRGCQGSLTGASSNDQKMTSFVN